MERRRTVLLRIAGRVQGVWFRAWTEQEATRLGLLGWVRNLSDGRVEALLEGPEDRVSRMIALCWQGPPAARVSGIEESPSEFDAGNSRSQGFEIRR